MANSPYVVILSADGAWRWSPPEHVKVVWDGSSHYELLRAVKRAVRLQGRWYLSLDGENLLPPETPIARGQRLHLISTFHRMVSVVPLPPEAQLHLQIQSRIGPSAAFEWAQAVFQAFAGGNSSSSSSLERFLSADSILLSESRELLHSIASKQARVMPAAVVIEIQRGEEISHLVKRAWRATTSNELPDPSVLDKLVLTMEPNESAKSAALPARRLLTETNTIVSGQLLRLELLFTGPFQLNVRNPAAQTTSVLPIQLEHRYSWPRPIPCATISSVCATVEAALIASMPSLTTRMRPDDDTETIASCTALNNIKEQLPNTKLISHAGRLLQEFSNLEEGAVPFGGSLEIKLTPALLDSDGTQRPATWFFYRGARVKALWHNERMYKGRVFTVRDAGVVAVAFDDGDFRDELLPTQVEDDDEETTGGSYGTFDLPSELLASHPAVQSSSIRKWRAGALILEDGNVIFDQ